MLGEFHSGLEKAKKIMPGHFLRSQGLAWRPGRRKFPQYDDKELLARARRNLAGCADWLADDLACLGTRWQTLSRLMRAATGRFTSVAEAVHFAQTSCEFEDRPRTAHESQFMTLYKAQLASEFPALAAHIDTFTDSPLSDPATVYRHKGRVVSKVLFFQARYVLFCLTWLPRPPQRILEIGGGYGGPARHWLTNTVAAPQTYIIVDTPEALFFAELFLSAEFGKDRVRYVSSTNALGDDALTMHRVILCPLMRTEALRDLTIDLVVNTGSLQEMTEYWVDHWMSWLDRQPCEFFYSLNYFGQRLDYMAEGLNLWAPRLSPQWVHRLQSYNPDWVRLQTPRNYAEIIAQKTGDGALSGDEARRRARLILEERFPNGTALLELLDLYRRSKDPNLAWDILSRFSEGSGPFPKELLYLAKTLEAETQWLRPASFQKILSHLQHVRDMGEEGAI